MARAEPTCFTFQTAASARHCERSEAIQLCRRETESWIASSLSLLAMTSKYDLAISRRDTPE
jgi:hypothetical protein